jgi:hypothetical protein
MPTRDVRGGPESVIREALQHWKECRAEELRRPWQAGIESRPGRFKSIDAIKKEARRQVAKTRTLSKRHKRYRSSQFDLKL